MELEYITQAVIFAAGKGTRMLPLTETCPKPMLKIFDKNLLEWKLLVLPPQITDVVFVVGYFGEQIEEYFGNNFSGRKIHYVEHQELNGTFGALLVAKPLLQERFLVMMGDDLYTKEDVEKLLTFKLAVLVKEIQNQEIGGEMMTNSDGTLLSIYEPKHFVIRGLINTGLYVLSKDIFNYEPVLVGGGSVEIGLPNTLVSHAKDAPVQLVHTKSWFQVSAPADLKLGEEFITTYLRDL